MGTSRVSAIVSTYNSEKFIRGCLDDLIAQTLYQRGELEIVVVVSGSKEGEDAVVAEYQQQHPNIVVVRTQRESMYAAWNRGIKQASGAYLTNANTDDRHAPDGIERLARELDNDSRVALVYGDCYLSTTPNETWQQCSKTRQYLYPDFFAPGAALHYQLSPQPMWRKSLHDSIGYFESSLRGAGDYDFNIRLAASHRAKHIGGKPVGLYLVHTGAISFKDNTMKKETDQVTARARTIESIEALYRAEGTPCVTAEDRARIHADMGIRAMQYYPPWFEGGSHQEPDFAIECCNRAYSLAPCLAVAVNNLAVMLSIAQEFDRAKQLIDTISVSDPIVLANRTELERLKATGDLNGNMSFLPSGLDFPSQYELVFRE